MEESSRCVPVPAESTTKLPVPERNPSNTASVEPLRLTVSPLPIRTVPRPPMPLTVSAKPERSAVMNRATESRDASGITWLAPARSEPSATLVEPV